MQPSVCGFLKVRNEASKEDNLYRCLENMAAFCTTIVACDDASTDGTDLILREFFVEHGIPLTQLIRVPSCEQDFRHELRWKERMLHIVHRIKPTWVWWQDGDEVLVDDGMGRNSGFLSWLASDPKGDGFRFPYVQLWRSGSWARIDDGFADGSFIKLWRWRQDLHFDVVDRTHHSQFPVNLGEIKTAPEGMHVLHFGNFGKNLQHKIHQYFGGLGGVERHRDFEGAIYRGLEHDYRAWPALLPASDPQPEPFSVDDKFWINEMRGLRGLEGWFTVVVPTHNRVGYLRRALDSLRKQIYQKWIALVLDDGSTDDTPRLMPTLQRAEPRLFYVRHPKRGAVAMNEIGMAMACEMTEFWTRLGSDDYFEPTKLFHDAVVLRSHPWCYGPYRVLRKVPADIVGDAEERQDHWQPAELCNIPDKDGRDVAKLLRQGHFRASWANVAARTELLRLVRQKHGNFCDPRLVNMEDFLVNARLAQLSFPVWRGRIRDDDRLLIAYDEASTARAFHQQHQYVHDAIWRVNPIGASSDGGTTASDDELTRKIIAEENPT